MMTFITVNLTRGIMYKVLRVIPSLDPCLGGVVTTISELCRAIHSDTKVASKTLVEVEILCFDDPESEWLSAFQGNVVYALGGGGKGFSYNSRYFKWLRDHAKNYDLVVLDGLWQYHSLAPLVLTKFNVPCVMFAHGMLDPYFNQFRLKYFKKLIFWWLIYRKVIKLSNAVLFTCDEEQRLARSSFPKSNFKSEVVKIGISPPIMDNGLLSESNFYHGKIGIEGKKVCLFLSRLHPKKGILELIDAISMESQYFLDNNYVFVIAGNGDSHFTNIIHKKINDLKLHDLVYIPGGFYGNDKWLAIKYADVFILPTHQENFGLVLAEAMSVGTAVITTTKSNVWKEIKDSNAGLICEDNVVSIKQCLVDWVSMEEERRAKIRRDAVISFERNFSSNAYLDSFTKMIQKVLENAKAR